MVKKLSYLAADCLRWAYWYPFRLLVQRLSVKNIYFLGKLMGILVYLFAIKRRKIIEQELILSLGRNLPSKKIKRIVRQSFKNFYQTQLEVFLYPKLNPDKIKETIQIEGKENLDFALSRGQGVILLFSHFGANQMIMPAIGYNGYKMNQLSGSAKHWLRIVPERANLINRKILELRWHYEQSLPARHIDVFGSLKPAIRCLKNKEILGIALDGGGGKKQLALNFLGRTASFSTGPMELAQRTNAAVLPTFIIRKSEGKHRLIIHPQINSERSNVHSDIHKFLTLLESYIKKYPCHYAQFLWLARKFTQDTDSPFFADYAGR
jgi:KDO2-lipid IV(A) lauroyltransferase